MGIRNYLIEGVSGTGKTSVCHELRRRGYQAINGDRELAYQGDPETGEPAHAPESFESEAARIAWSHARHIWDIGKVKALAADQGSPISFFCGGSRNFHRFIDLFDAVFVLDVDRDTLLRRLAGRGGDEFGGREIERALVERVHTTKEDIPKDAIVVDATAPLARVVDEILAKCEEVRQV